MPTNRQLLGATPILRFRYLNNGFVAAFKNKWQMPKEFIENNFLTKSYPFVIIPRGGKPEIEVPYLAPDIEIDEDHPEWTFLCVRYYRCYTNASTLKIANLENILKHLKDPPPGKIVRKLHIINGGKK